MDPTDDPEPAGTWKLNGVCACVYQDRFGRTDDAGHLEHYVAVYADISSDDLKRDHSSSLAALHGCTDRAAEPGQLPMTGLHHRLAISARNANGSQFACMILTP